MVDSSDESNAIVHSILALVLLVTATVLAVYKPFGMTPYGARRQENKAK